MSHFSVHVAVPPQVDDLDAYVEKVLEPYSEELHVAPYNGPCWCVGRVAREAAGNACALELGSIEDARSKFHEQHAADVALAIESTPEGDADAAEARVDALWRSEFAEPRQKRERELLAARPDRDDPDPSCSECGGTGVCKETSNYNPVSKWDWFVIGGRWDESLWPEDSKEPKANVRPMRDWLRDFDAGKVHSPFAFVSANGQWHEKARMGWWGMTSNADPAWADRFRNLAGGHSAFRVVVVDCHI